jgi:hypothetical protein
MTYRPAESMFGPPWSARIPSVLYVLLAGSVVALVASAEMAQGGALRAYLIERPHPIEARTFAALLAVGALASLVRSSMRGVRIRGDALEFRDVASLGWPKVRRYKWAQIDRIVFEEDRSVALDLWDGTRAFLPVVSDPRRLSTVLEKVAAARAIPVTGGVGLDEIPETEEFESEPP